MIDRDYWPTTDWRTAPPEEHGVDPVYLERADRFAREEAPQVAGMLIARHGHVVFERYYHDYGQDSYFSVASITKSVLSALVGIALRDGLLPSIDEPIAPYFPDAETHGITIRELLSLTAGWPYYAFPNRPKTVRDMLAEPLASQPGERFQYGETPPHLVSAILTKVSGLPAVQLAMRELFEPLGIWRDAAGWRERPGTLNHAGHPPGGGPPWACDRDGISCGGFGLHLSLRDIARFGLLYASGGHWDGRQIVPAEYVAESGRPHSRGGSPMWMPYGLLWWLPAWHRHVARWAAGFGGQTVYVNAGLDLVIAVACEVNPQEGDPNDGGLFNRHLLPAIRDW